ncbi:MAG: hypothetical protein IPK78_06160 [Rhodospirillales bacterium]|nr:hypothetical protein [Rhodospirillales bacterium]
MKRLLCYLAFLVILVFLGSAWTARAAEAEPDSFAQIATSWDQRLAYAESIIARSANTIDEHPQIREILLAIQRDASEAGKRFTADAKATQRLLDALGPEPEKGAPPEEKDVAETRAELQQKLAAARARVARTEIALSRARDLSTEVRDDFRNQFLQTLAQRLPLPDSIDDIRDGAREVSHTVFSIVAAPIAWWQRPVGGRKASGLPSLAAVRGAGPARGGHSAEPAAAPPLRTRSFDHRAELSTPPACRLRFAGHHRHRSGPGACRHGVLGPRGSVADTGLPGPRRRHAVRDADYPPADRGLRMGMAPAVRSGLADRTAEDDVGPPPVLANHSRRRDLRGASLSAERRRRRGHRRPSRREPHPLRRFLHGPRRHRHHADLPR